MVNYIPRYNFALDNKLQCFQGFLRRKINAQRVLVLNLEKFPYNPMYIHHISFKTMAISPEYCKHTSAMNNYCVNKRGFQFLSFFFLFSSFHFLFFPLFHRPLSTVPPAFLFPFLLSSRRDLNQRFPVSLPYH